VSDSGASIKNYIIIIVGVEIIVTQDTRGKGKRRGGKRVSTNIIIIVGVEIIVMFGHTPISVNTQVVSVKTQQ
jgi:hypothetical protein